MDDSIEAIIKSMTELHKRAVAKEQCRIGMLRALQCLYNYEVAILERYGKV